MSRDPSPPASLRLLQAVQSVLGDPESSVEYINTSLGIADGALVFCIGNQSVYQFSLSSAHTADGDRVVEPVVGPGQWQKMPNPSLLKGQIVVPISAIAPNAQETVTAALADADVGDTLALSPTADLPANLAVAWARVSAAGFVSINMANIGSGTVSAATFTFDVGAAGSLPA